MAIKRSSKINSGFSMASMTDIVFLLLIFFLVTSTLINPNALKILLPKSTNQITTKKPIVTVTIKDLGNNKYEYYVGTKPVSFEQIEPMLQQELKDQEEPTIMVYANPTVIWDEIVKMMNIAKRNNYKMAGATNPE